MVRRHSLFLLATLAPWSYVLPVKPVLAQDIHRVLRVTSVLRMNSLHWTVWWIWAILSSTRFLTLVPSIYAQLFYPFSSLHFLRTKFVCISPALSYSWFGNICRRIQNVLVSSFGIIFISVTLKNSSTLLYKATRRITPWHVKYSGFKVGCVKSNYQPSFTGSYLILFFS